MRCPNCNTENKESSLLCEACGFPLDKVASAPSRQTADERDSDLGHDINKNNDAIKQESKTHSNQSEVKQNNPFGDPTEGIQSFSGSFDLPSNAKQEHDSPSSFSNPYAQYSRSAYQKKQKSEDEKSEEVLDKEEPKQGESIEEQQDIPQESSPSYEPQTDNNDPQSTIQMPRIESEPAPKSTDFKSSSAVSGGMRIKPGIIIGIIIAVACAVAIYLFAFGPLSGREVPDVVGMNAANAQSALEKEHFKSKILEVKSDEEEGTILLSDPSPHSRAPEGSEVVLHVATTRTIPDVLGKEESEALSLLKQNGYERIITEREKSPDEENIILSITPNQGDRAKSNVEITIVVSEAYRVPNVMNMDIEAARTLVADEGFEPNVIYVDSNEHPPGTILGTSPEIGTKIKEGDMVTINVARPRGVELVGLSQSYLAPGALVNIGGTEYEIESQGSFSYVGNDAVAYSVTGRPRAYLAGEIVYASSRTLSGQIQWSPTNQVMSIS